MRFLAELGKRTRRQMPASQSCYSRRITTAGAVSTNTSCCARLRRELPAAFLALLFIAGSVAPGHALDFRQSEYDAGFSPNAIAMGDFNGDGNPDLVIANSCPNYKCTHGVVKVWLGNGDGTFSGGTEYRSAVDAVSADITAADFNNDGKLDVAVVNVGYNSVDIGVLLGRGDGSFHGPQSVNAGGVAMYLAAGDFNGDGRMDLAVTLNTEAVAILLGNGDGTFQPPVTYPVETSPQGLAVADLNSDGKPDLAVVNFCGHRPRCYHGTVSILLGRGDGTFTRQKSYFVGIEPLWVGVADFNHDGNQDLVVTLPCGTDKGCNTEGGMGILLGNGDGSFQPVTPYLSADTYSIRLGVSDINRDGNPDVVGVSLRTGNIAVFLGNGDGTLQPPLSFTVGEQPLALAIGNFNADRRPDIAVVNQDSQTVSILIQRRR
jgi:hypothetical protein